MKIAKQNLTLDAFVARMIVFNLYCLMAKAILAIGSEWVFRNAFILNIWILLSLGIQVVFVMLNYRKQIRFNIVSLFLVMCLFMMWGYTYLMHPEYFSDGIIGGYFQDFCIYSLMALLFIPCMSDLSYITEYMYKYIYIMFFLALITFYMFQMRGHEVGTRLSSSMTYGYHVSVLGTIMMNKYFIDKKTKDLLMAILMFFFVGLRGSRFAILIIGVYFVVRISIYCLNEHKYFRLALLFFFIATMLMNIKYFIQVAYQIIKNFGISGGRALERMLYDGLINDNGRGRIHDILIEYVNQKKLFGYGAGGVGIDSRIAQPHGFIYDMFMTFGYFGSFLIIVFFVVMICWAYHKTDIANQNLFLVLLCSFIPTITIERCIWDQYQFWWCWAIGIYILTKRKPMRE